MQEKYLLWKRTFACIFEMAFIVLSIISAKKIEQKITENIVFTKRVTEERVPGALKIFVWITVFLEILTIYFLILVKDCGKK